MLMSVLWAFVVCVMVNGLRIAYPEKNHIKPPEKPYKCSYAYNNFFIQHKYRLHRGHFIEASIDDCCKTCYYNSTQCKAYTYYPSINKCYLAIEWPGFKKLKTRQSGQVGYITRLKISAPILKHAHIPIKKVEYEPTCKHLDTSSVIAIHPSAAYVSSSKTCLVVEDAGQKCNRFPSGHYAIITNNNRSEIASTISTKLAKGGHLWGYHLSDGSNLGLHYDNAENKLTWIFNDGQVLPAVNSALDKDGLQSSCPMFTRGHAGLKDDYISDGQHRIGGCKNLYSLCQYPPKWIIRQE